MARIELDLPERFLFETEMTLRASDVNYAGHLGNDMLQSLLQEARIRFFEHNGFDERDVEGVGIVITDAAVVYRSEAFRGERLVIRVALADFNDYGCDVLFQVTEARAGREVARAKTGLVFFDYHARKVRKIPRSFAAVFLQPSNVR